MFKKFLALYDEIEGIVPTKKRILYNLLSLIISAFFILPFVLLDINLLYLYYELEILLIIILHILFIILIMIYIKFLLSFIKQYELETYSNKNTFYIVGFIFSLVVVVITFTIYLILRR